ncbi:tryptophan-rich sensory protein [Frigoribacterium sp. VKM Ac-1396]|uniref:tryptophan-rich sensory protein n=1 Tax=Frigoribacterium sp. VKM Ac-1396 TaxID=2783821 RepID=UPI00188C998B|nr:tryptophan-rich sensory protein [Frigoribacterium sp. VKM Ac-1396]MBF4601829.1 tryptophan-rich sensory protein [Frigoribacterium sp. VKM Ac-1396]
MTTNASTHAPAEAATSRDVVRQIVVVVTAVLAIVLAAVGSGAFGGVSVADAAGGALSATATTVAPATTAFGIWSVIYLGLVAYAIYQALPGQRAVTRHRRLGYWVAASLLLNAAWLFAAVQLGSVWLGAVVIVALLLVLARIFVILFHTASSGWVDAVVTDGTLGLYLGWVSVATVANVAAGLVDAGFDGFGFAAGFWSSVVLGVAALVGVVLAFAGRGRIAPALSLSWGLAWIAVGRLTGEPENVVAGVAAIVAAVFVLVVTIGVRVARGRVGATASLQR